MKCLVASFAIAAAAVTLAPPAVAAPPVSESGHVHHVITGNGDCVQIDSVRFLAQPRGLHQGATASGRERGPWHGPCR